MNSLSLGGSKDIILDDNDNGGKAGIEPQAPASNMGISRSPSNPPARRPLASSVTADPKPKISRYTTQPTGPQWNITLPVIELDKSDPEFSIDDVIAKGFSIRGLITALQSGIKRGKLQHYLSFFSESIVAQHMNMSIGGFPAIFYAVATNDEKIVRMWVNNGGDVNAVDGNYGIPLLGFAVLMADILGSHTTAVTITLLSLGADISVIPRIFFTPYLDDPPAKAPFNHREFDEPGKQWCQDYMRPMFARAVNLTQRYFFEKTLKDKKPSERQMQVAITHNATALLGISYFLIGQSSAAKTVTQKLLSHMALPRSKPLVLVFSGPSGHGKTELAKRMGELLSLELECIDCTELKHETDLFGPKKPYIGHEAGSPLNNFLTRLTGRRCIVFLDEFEKTTKEVQNSLLIPFDEGKYTDRRNRQPVDCSKTIWIIATNALDDIILDFCDIYQDDVHDTSDQLRHSELMTDLSNRLKKQLKSTFGNPLSGRISLVLPFLPFSPSEAAVIVHKYLLELQSHLSQAVQLSGQQLVGRINLCIKNDGAICSLLASEGYDADQGARSLKSAVELRVADELVGKYLEEDGRIEDGQRMVRYTVDVTRGGGLVVFKAEG
ncbi:P-loop containing nucleoside triphosphate hydrolase protein [Lepidopterella palustris CBS 459.81]|uniref:P-loop containing nucleoside triphosphate hydrolase protein n=1 Tax=Lepidopterella palustris CBS 459.81 TaxID=1314670 RepID=A0A8E2E6X9_9PEZI|nr:P-loop containing nucleoside triphosphate hydrolase protein [Lepidopterella palustris CBS 459.81]